MNAGDKVIFVSRYGDQPEVRAVTKVTPSGQITINTGHRFKPNRWNLKEYEIIGDRHSAAKCYPHTQEKLDELVANVETKKMNDSIKKALEDERRQEYEARKALELAQVKEACHGWLQQRMVDTLADGSRLYVFHLPVKAGYTERKKGVEVVIVRCWNAKPGWDEKETTDVEYAITYCTGASTSFASVSSQRAPNDEAALWEAAASRYHDGW